jgi:voltage-gated potassium channel
MGKVKIPRQKQFTNKVFFALIILLSLVFMAYLGLMFTGLGNDQSIAKSIEIVTHVDIVNEPISFRYFFAFLSLLGGVVQFYFVYVILEYVLDGKFQDIFYGVAYMNKIKKMKDYYLVAGGGRVGSHAAKMLKDYDKQVVIVDTNEEVVLKLRKDGLTAIKGDVLDESFLKEIDFEQAKFLVACLGSDSDNILLILTAKEINPGIKISARANTDSVVQKLKHAGASYVVVPSSLGGEELAKTAARTD